MDRTRIPLSLFASCASVPVRGRDRRAAEIKGMVSTAYNPAKDYWKKPLEAIRRGAAPGRTRGLTNAKFTSSDPTRVRNYRAAVREFAAWSNLFDPEPLSDPSSSIVSVDPFDVVVGPDFAAKVGGLRYLIRVRFTKGAQLLPPERLITTSLIWEGFQPWIPAILDLEAGEFSSGPGSDQEALESIAADRASRWPSN